MTTLKYVSHARIEDLVVGECTIHRASGSRGGRWWQLWFHVLREPDGRPDIFCVPVNPNGPYIDGPGGRTWGLLPSALPAADGTKKWAISPSINVLANGDADTHKTPIPSLWHQTPEILNVLPTEPWACGALP
jgi:hypothetical protein